MNGNPDGGMPGTVCSDCTPTGTMTSLLPSPTGAKIWTTPTMDKVLREATPPTTPADSIGIYAAKNEYEPFQVVVRPDANGNASLSMTAFTGPETIDPGHIEIRRVGYVKVTTSSDASSIQSPSGMIPDPLELTSFGTMDSLTGAQNQPYWITVYVPPSAVAGDYTATLTVTVSGMSKDIPVKLHVYNFAIPAKIGFDGNWNSSFQALGGSASLAAVQTLKDFFYAHRLVPSSVAWPAGLNWNGGITYDCNGNFQQNTGDAYDFSNLGPKYIDGVGWNGVGFPSFEIMQFQDNSTPRFNTFCSQTKGADPPGNSAYNAKWNQLLSSLNAYLLAHGDYKDKGYYYVQNEPQNQADYDIAAYLANLTKAAAPNLRIALSEEPKPEIAENATYPNAKYDLWIADLSAFEPNYAKLRQAKGEQVWWYFLYGDLPPHFNPITIDHSGVESRVAFWGAWKYRITGFAYYSVTGWGSDPYNNPKPMNTNQNGDGFLLYPPKSGNLVSSIRWELLRDGVEDFEYFLLAGGALPQTSDIASPVDTSVLSAVSSTTSYTRDTAALQHLRDQLGLKIEGKVNGFPVIDSHPPGQHPRAAYYINFQDPAGMPTQSPLVANGHTWQKIGWDAYDPQKGYGWAGPNIGDPTIMKYQYRSGAPDVLQASIIYDDYGRTDTFNWDLENGKYNITVSIGWDGGNYPKNKVVIEGTALFDNVATTPAAPYVVRSLVVDVSDGNLTMEAGQFNEYTMLNWLSIEPM